MSFALFVPAPLNTVSGGYGYDRALLAGLRAAGQAVEAVELGGRHPVADATARDSAAAALGALPVNTRPIIDGLCLPAFAGLADRLAAADAIGLIHHPTALERGYAESEREALRAVERALFPALPRVIATSAPTARQLVADYGVDEARVAVVEPGTEPARRSAGSRGTARQVLSIGALTPRKGHDVLLRALATLPDLDWRLTVVGSARDPVYAGGLLPLAEELGVAQRLQLAGEVDAATLDALWDAADVFALASWWEGYGMAVAEAFARGVPVAVTAGGALAELVPVEAGVVAAPGDVVALGRALRRILFDDAMRAEMAEAAWQAGQLLPRWSDRAAAFLAAVR